jgi:hypothetical protein
LRSRRRCGWPSSAALIVGQVSGTAMVLIAIALAVEQVVHG